MTPDGLLISIDRTVLGLSPLVASGEDDTIVLGVTEYQEPGLHPRIHYAPTPRWVHGDMPLSWSWQQAILGFSLVPNVETETAARALHAELVAAVTQALEFDVTVTVADAAPEVWRCNPGAVEYPQGRSLGDLMNHNAVWAVTLPCYPVRS